MTSEVRKFGAEVGKILNLVIHSLYTNKEIFLRELISNSSDACDRLRYLSLNQPDLIKDDPNFSITISINKEDRTLSLVDNGIGMNKEDLIENLGTIARSGTQAFLENLSDKKDNGLIGQFGVGFYSVYMVADKVIIRSCKAGESKTYEWSSDGTGEYAVGDSENSIARGTEITAFIRDSEKEYLDHTRIKHIIKLYSDHISFPIYFIDEGGSKTQINSSSALWTKPKSQISKQEYSDFYRGVSYAYDDPWLVMHNKNEGTVEFTNLLFIPSSKTFDLFHPDRRTRVKLYIKKVFITDENIDIVPRYLRFLRGVIDCEDLPLNISRETLQHNAVIEKIKSIISKKVIAELKKHLSNELNEYINFWNNFGAVIKEGLCETLNQPEELLGVCLFHSVAKNKIITLDEYIAEFKRDEEKNIYYLSGDNKEKLLNSPQIEGLLSKGIDVLLFTDAVDDFWVNIASNYKGFGIKSVTRSNIKLDTQEQEEGYDKLVEYFKKILSGEVKDVIISKKLTSSPVCLSVEEGDVDIRMERFLIEQKQMQKESLKILEINPRHRIIEKINKELCSGVDSPQNDDLVTILFGQACINEGEPIKDASNFCKKLNSILVSKL